MLNHQPTKIAPINYQIFKIDPCLTSVWVATTRFISDDNGIGTDRLISESTIGNVDDRPNGRVVPPTIRVVDCDLSDIFIWLSFAISCNVFCISFVDGDSVDDDIDSPKTANFWRTTPVGICKSIIHKIIFVVKWDLCRVIVIVDWRCWTVVADYNTRIGHRCIAICWMQRCDATSSRPTISPLNPTCKKRKKTSAEKEYDETTKYE